MFGESSVQIVNTGANGIKTRHSQTLIAYLSHASRAGWWPQKFPLPWPPCWEGRRV